MHLRWASKELAVLVDTAGHILTHVAPSGTDKFHELDLSTTQYVPVSNSSVTIPLPESRVAAFIVQKRSLLD